MYSYSYCPISNKPTRILGNVATFNRSYLHKLLQLK